jgi:hypothetical protein
MAILLNNSFHQNYLGMAFSVLVRETKFHNSLRDVSKILHLTVALFFGIAVICLLHSEVSKI